MASGIRLCNALKNIEDHATSRPASKESTQNQNSWTSVYHKALAPVPIFSPVTAPSLKTSFYMT